MLGGEEAPSLPEQQVPRLLYEEGRAGVDAATSRGTPGALVTGQSGKGPP